MNSLFAQQPLHSVFWPAQKNRVLDFFLVISGVIFLAISAQIVIPLQPVPLTLQSAMALLLGMVYGSRRSFLSLLSYYLLGAAGLPIFAGMSGGISVFAGPTVGYMIGMLVAATMVGFFAERGWANHILSSFLTACLGAVVIFFFGVTVLAQFTGWEKAFLLGVAPFIITEPLKLLAISCIVPRCWKAK